MWRKTAPVLQQPVPSMDLNQMVLPVMITFTVTVLIPVTAAPASTVVIPAPGLSVTPVRKILTVVWILRVPHVGIMPIQIVPIQIPVMEQVSAFLTMLLPVVPVRMMVTSVQMTSVMVWEFAHIPFYQQVLSVGISPSLIALLRMPVMVRGSVLQTMPLQGFPAQVMAFPPRRIFVAIVERAVISVVPGRECMKEVVGIMRGLFIKLSTWDISRRVIPNPLVLGVTISGC